jgi:hypothetical protein
LILCKIKESPLHFSEQVSSNSPDKLYLIKNIHDVIITKLQCARQLVQFDKEISAGLYTYALEEFGKLLLVKEGKLKNNQYGIKSE